MISTVITFNHQHSIAKYFNLSMILLIWFFLFSFFLGLAMIQHTIFWPHQFKCVYLIFFFLFVSLKSCAFIFKWIPFNGINYNNEKMKINFVYFSLEYKNWPRSNPCFNILTNPVVNHSIPKRITLHKTIQNLHLGNQIRYSLY